MLCSSYESLWLRHHIHVVAMSCHPQMVLGYACLFEFISCISANLKLPLCGVKCAIMSICISIVGHILQARLNMHILKAFLSSSHPQRTPGHQLASNRHKNFNRLLIFQRFLSFLFYFSWAHKDNIENQFARNSFLFYLKQCVLKKINSHKKLTPKCNKNCLSAPWQAKLVR